MPIDQEMLGKIGERWGLKIIPDYSSRNSLNPYYFQVYRESNLIATLIQPGSQYAWRYLGRFAIEMHGDAKFCGLSEPEYRQLVEDLGLVNQQPQPIDALPNEPGSTWD